MQKTTIFIILLFTSILLNADVAYDNAYDDFLYKKNNGPFKLYDEKCENGSMRHCYNIGVMYDVGGRIESDKIKKKQYYTKACNNNYMAGCYQLGHIYSMTSKGKANSKEIKIFYEKACSGNYMKACFKLGKLYSEGYHIEKDKLKAKEYYKIACDGKDMEACNKLADIYFNTNVFDSYSITGTKLFARELDTKACTGGIKKSCKNLKTRYTDMILKEECDKKNYESCYQLGMNRKYQIKFQYKSFTDGIKLKDLFTKACNGGLSKGCYYLGWIYKEGTTVKQDKRIAKEQFGIACERGHEDGCRDYKKLNENGIKEYSTFEKLVMKLNLLISHLKQYLLSLF